MKNHRIVAQARVASPLGPLTLAATEQGLAGAWFDGQAHHPGPIDAPVDAAQRHIVRAARAFDAYWRDRGAAVDLDLDAEGTDFQREVWRALRTIAPGRTTTYGEIAQRIGRPLAVRAVGAAVGRNPISILVPCHRVVGRDGSLTGYAGGLPRKQALLAHEAASP